MSKSTRVYQKCAVLDCNNEFKTNSKIMYHRFPVNDSGCLMWLIKINNPLLAERSLAYIRQCYSVCNKHFEISCFQTLERKKLNRGVVPTLFLSKEEPVPLPDVEVEEHSTSTEGLYSNILFIYSRIKNMLISFLGCILEAQKTFIVTSSEPKASTSHADNMTNESISSGKWVL